jgi:hypothetical protein
MDDAAFQSFRTEFLTLLEHPMELGDSDPGPVRLADEIVACSRVTVSTCERRRCVAQLAGARPVFPATDCGA